MNKGKIFVINNNEPGLYTDQVRLQCNGCEKSFMAILNEIAPKERMLTITLEDSKVAHICPYCGQENYLIPKRAYNIYEN